MTTYFIRRVMFGMLLWILCLNNSYADTVSGSFGKSVSVDNKSIVIDTAFLEVLKSDCTAKRLEENYWELVYLINIGNQNAMGIGIDLLSRSQDDASNFQHLDVHFIAIALSHRDVFWDVLKEKNSYTIKKIIDYYDKRPQFYLGHDYNDNKQDALGIFYENWIKGKTAQ